MTSVDIGILVFCESAALRSMVEAAASAIDGDARVVEQVTDASTTAAVVVETTTSALARFSEVEGDLGATPIVAVCADGAVTERAIDGRCRLVEYLTAPIDARLLRSKLELMVELALHRFEVERLNATFEERLRAREAELLDSFIAQERLHDELINAQKIEAVGRLAGSVAHDYNNLLMGIRGCVDIALGRLEGGHPARPFLEQASQAVRRGSSLTRQLLLFSGNKHRELVDLSVDDLLGDAEPMIRTVIGEQSQLELELDAGDWKVRADRGRLEQVLMNLVANARDAMPRGGALTIRSGRRATPRGDAVVIAISDTGAGMSEEVQARIFEPFFTTKKLGEGTGLGLSTVRRIVTDREGWIEVSSAVGEGTTVEVFLPRVGGASQATSSALSSPLASRARRVLLVEDEALVRMSLRAHLESAGLEVVDAADAKSARQAARDLDAIDLLLTDVMLPGGTGPEIASAVIDRHPNAAVVFMSAHSKEKLVAAGRLPENATILQKPFGKQTLFSLLGRILDHSHAPVVLLVEDNAATRMAIVAHLGDCGYDVVATASAREVPALLESPIAALLVDFELGDLRGDDVARMVRQKWPGVGVLFLSGHASLPVAASEVVLSKPIDLDELVEALQDVIS